MSDARPYPKALQLFRPTRRRSRRVASREEMELIRARKLGQCRVCEFIDHHPAAAAWLGLERCQRSVSLHHLVGRDLLGGDLPENLVPLGGSGTTGHHGLVEELDQACCMAVRETLRPDEVAYVVSTAGEAFLDRRYPQLEMWTPRSVA